MKMKMMDEDEDIVKLLEELRIKEEVKKRLKPPGIAYRRQGPLHNMRKLKDALRDIN